MVSKRRSFKGGAGLFGLALVAVLALSALGAGAASAAEAPRWKVNSSYLGAGATKAFTATSTTELVLTFGTLSLKSPAGECTTTGEIEGSAAEAPGKRKNVVLTCKNVKLFASGVEQTFCTVKSIGAEAGTITTKPVNSTLVWLNPTGGAAGDLLEPVSGTALTAIEISGAACAASQKVNLTTKLINDILPVEENAVTGQPTLPSTTIASYYNNEASRAKQTLPQLKVGAVNATLTGKFAFSLNSKEPVGVSSVSSGSASRWKVGGWFLGAGVTKSFAATSTEPMVWESTITLQMPECTATGKLVGSSPGQAGGKEDVVITCTGVTLKNDPVNCTVRSPGFPNGTIRLNELHSSLNKGLLESAGVVLLTPEIVGAACAFTQKVSWTGTLKDETPATGIEASGLATVLSGSSMKFGSNLVTVKGAMNTSLPSGELFGVFLG